MTLSSLIMRNRFNDLGFLVRDRLLVLVECQSTFTENILIRFILYLADTYNRYISKMNLNVYGTKKVRLPIPELYVIYHGDRETNRMRFPSRRISSGWSPLITSLWT